MFSVIFFDRIFQNAILVIIFFSFNLGFGENVVYSVATSGSPSSTNYGVPKNDLCLPNHSIISCSFQLVPEFRDDSCSLVKYNKSSSECTSSSFRGSGVDADEKVGKVLLFPYILYNNYAYIAFNVTLTDIKWKSARFRFYETGFDIPDLCSEFKLSDDTTQLVLSNNTLFYDCLWTKEEIELKTYHFQYLAYPSSGGSPVSRQYVFYVPAVSTLGTDCDPCPPFREKRLKTDEIELFLSVDVSVLPKLGLYFQTAHKMYNISRYRVQLIRSLLPDEQTNKWVVLTKEVPVLPNETYFFFLPDTDFRPGLYNFTVTPLHDSCSNGECRISKAPGIMIVGNLETELLIGMVVAVILIPILIAVYVRLRNDRNPPDMEQGFEPPKVLFVYNSDYKSHIDDLIKFYDYLKGCHVEPKMDLLDIRRSSPQMSPNVWYYDRFQEANCILIFTPPPDSVTPELHDLNTFRNLTNSAFSQLDGFLSQHEISRYRQGIVTVGKKLVFSVQMPGCDWKNLNKIARCFKKLSLPDDIDKLLKFIGIPVQKPQQYALERALNADIFCQVVPLDSSPFTGLSIDSNGDEDGHYDSEIEDSSENSLFNRWDWLSRIMRQTFSFSSSNNNY